MKHRNIIKLVFICSVILLTVCQEEKMADRPYPRVRTIPVSNINDSGAVFNADVFYKNSSDRIIEYGFIWSKSSNPSYDNSYRTSKNDDISTGKFNFQIKTTLKEETTYYVKAFLHTNDYMVYGNEVSFVSMGSNSPKIEGFFPKKGTFNDTLIITGSFLWANLSSTEVILNNCRAEIIEQNEKVIKCKIPCEITSPEFFPLIRFGDLDVSFTESFKITPPIINSMFPDTVYNAGDTLKISGDFFNPISDYNKVIANDKNARVIKSTRRELSLIVPKDLIVASDVSQLSTFKISVTISSQTAQSDKVLIFDYHSRWTKLADFPGEPRIWPVAFGYNGKGYYGFGSYDYLNNYRYNKHYGDLWEYNPVSNTWKKITEIPSIPRGKVASFIIGSKIYLCCGTMGDILLEQDILPDVWEYDLDKDTWTRKADFPGIKRYSAFGFSLNGKGYIGAGCKRYGYYNILKDVWQYDPVNDSWVLIGNIPEIAGIYIEHGLIAFSNSQNGFLGFRDQYPNIESFWKFNDVLLTWEKASPKPGYWQNATGFTIENNIFVGLAEIGTGLPVYQGTKDFYKYDVTSNSWINIGFGGPQRFAAGGFSIGNKGFICGGFHNSEYSNLVDLWMFDPTK